jgi:tripartite ATP-independent transporter DctP family solute receptor
MSTLVPVASINGIGFAYPTYDKVWESLDGPLGGHVRKAFSNAGIVCLEKSWNHGFRQVTSSTKPILTPDDLNGFKIRVPPSPLWTAMFKAFGAAPVSIPWAETYSAMQTRIADGLEQPLVGLLVDKMYEVQKHCSLTNHMWDGFWILSNKRMWDGIPAKLREIIERNINEEALRQRAEVENMNATLQAELQKRGLEFHKVDNNAFRDKLVAAGFYGEWKKRYGEEAWALLEATTGKLG